eukprot:TRINITY_DN4004_c0_g1_i1.p1 TRINITY_DN4004_c0_g1~~TRINITY_DN4004_c0_g1_i1.p1  ORF type:complete len:615 (-),score=115.62 TRINITY_DN4004_c0_g1_i1:142-1986(-)
MSLDSTLAESIEYIREHNIPTLFNNITLHVLSTRPSDPVNELISYLQSVDAGTAPVAPTSAPTSPPRTADSLKQPTQDDSRRVSFVGGEQKSDKKKDKGTAAQILRRQSVAGKMIQDHELTEAEEKRRRKLWLTLFPMWDIDGNGHVDLYELQQVLLTFDEVSHHNSKKKMIMRLAAALKTEGKGNKLDRENFAELLLQISRDLNEADFEAFYTKVKGSLEKVANVTKGSGRKRVLWQLFRHWDMNDNGFIEYSEMEEVFHELEVYKSNKSIKRQTVKWRHKVAALTSEDQKTHEVEEGEEHRISLSEFHGMVSDIFHKLTESEFYKTVEEMHKLIADIKRRKRAEYVEKHGGRQGVLGPGFFRRGSVSNLLAHKQKQHDEDELVGRRATWNRLFPLWDIDGSGSIDMFELQQVLLRFEDIQGASEKKLLTRMQNELKDSGKANQLELDDFCDLMVQLTLSMDGDEHASFAASVEQELNDIADVTYGSDRKRAMWHLFHAWDLNGNGYLDLDELQAVLADIDWYKEVKAERHRITWKHKIQDMWVAEISGGPADDDDYELQFSLADFHAFLQNCLNDYDDEKFFLAIDEMHAKLLEVNKAEAEKAQAALLADMQ